MDLTISVSKHNTTTGDLQYGVSVCALFRASVCMHSFLNI